MSLTTAFHLQLATQMLPDYHLLPHQHLHPPSHHLYIRFSLKHSPSLSPLSYLTLSLVQACSRPHAHHKYKAIHTREGSCRGCQTVTHQPSVWKWADSLRRFLHTCSSRSRSHRSTFTLLPHPAATSHIHTCTDVTKANTPSWQLIIRSQCTGWFHAFSVFTHSHAISTHEFWWICCCLDLHADTHPTSHTYLPPASQSLSPAKLHHWQMTSSRADACKERRLSRGLLLTAFDEMIVWHFLRGSHSYRFGLSGAVL